MPKAKAPHHADLVVIASEAEAISFPKGSSARDCGVALRAPRNDTMRKAKPLPFGMK
jgi:hypothetical protein